MRRLEASLRRATPKGHETFISPTAPHQGLVPTSALLAFRTHSGTHNLPFAVGAILATLALALVSYLLASTVRRRRRELAIVKTLGFTRSQVRWTVASQASTLLIIAMTAGIPLGILAGRWAWDLLATQQGVIPEPVTPATILLVVPVMISLGITIALFPAVVAARTQPSRALRAE